jgi:hypothetical protein
VLIAAGAGAVRAQTAVQSGATGVLDTVQPGDTLIGIASRLLESTDLWHDLQRLNRVGVPRRLEPGKVLRIRAERVRADPAPFAIREVGGTATLDGAPARAGDVGREGSRIETGANGVVVMTLGDGTTLTIAPACAVRVDRLRR